MELFLLVISIVILIFIGAEVFSLLLALSGRMVKPGSSNDDADTKESSGTEAVSKDDAATTDAAAADNDVISIDDTEPADDNKIRDDQKATDDRNSGDVKTSEDTVSDEVTVDSSDEAEDGPVLPDNDLVCETCGHVMKWYEMIPLISYIALRGRCRMCGDKIPVRDFCAEILGGALFVLLFFRFGADVLLKSNVHFTKILDITAAMDIYRALGVLLLIAFFSLLFLVSAVDIRKMVIPDVLSILMLVLGIASIFIYKDVSWKEHLIGLVCISLPMLIIALVIPGAFGGGDIKLMAGIGLFLGWKLVLVAMFFAILTGGIWAIVLLAGKKADRKGHFAFGPFLCFGAALSAFCGYELLTLYLSFARGFFL